MFRNLFRRFRRRKADVSDLNVQIENLVNERSQVFEKKQTEMEMLKHEFETKKEIARKNEYTQIYSLDILPEYMKGVMGFIKASLEPMNHEMMSRFEWENNCCLLNDTFGRPLKEMRNEYSLEDEYIYRGVGNDPSPYPTKWNHNPN
jgi:hypothetical protein